MNSDQNDLKLLPVKFKRAALGVLALVILFSVLYKLEMFEMDKEISKSISITGILLSLLILAITRSKVEDELTLRIRLRAFASSFIFGVGFIIIEPFVNLLFGDNFIMTDEGAPDILLIMLLFYFFSMFIMKRNR